MSKDEHISALMDGELNEAETGRLLDQLQRDAGLRMCWTRYHLISDALRSDLTCHIKHNVASRVIQALESEPTHLSPRRLTPHPSRLTPHIFKPLAGLAVAASIAAVAVLGLQTTAPLQTASPVNLAGLSGAAPVAQVSSAAGRSRWSAGRPSVESKLDIYLANHNQYSMSTEMQGMLPYARIVGYETNP
ncbi:MAG: sigma-E factor negative regulatory protein [Gammaproteobacteria bacterium]|nr:sigma-E factor negative regulatory protein [Gammaproteobacteria bacterium]